MSTTISTPPESSRPAVGSLSATTPATPSTPDCGLNWITSSTTISYSAPPTPWGAPLTTRQRSSPSTTSPHFSSAVIQLNVEPQIGARRLTITANASCWLTSGPLVPGTQKAAPRYSATSSTTGR